MRRCIQDFCHSADVIIQNPNDYFASSDDPILQCNHCGLLWVLDMVTNVAMIITMELLGGVDSHAEYQYTL